MSDKHPMSFMPDMKEISEGVHLLSWVVPVRVFVPIKEGRVQSHQVIIDDSTLKVILSLFNPESLEAIEKSLPPDMTIHKWLLKALHGFIETGETTEKGV